MAEGRHWLGISGMFLSSLLFGLMAFFVRVVSFDASHFFVVFIRSLGGIVLLVLLYFVKVVSFHPVNKKLLVMRGFFGAVALILWFHNIKVMSLSKAVFYFYSYPLYTALASRILYREKVFLWNLAGMGALISGLIILSNLWKFDFQTKDVLGIISGLFAGLAMSFVHELRKTDSAWTIVMSFLITSTVMSLPFALFAVPSLETGTWITLLMVPVVATAAQVIMTYSYKFCTATQGSVVSSTSIIFPIALSCFFLEERLSAEAAAGGLLILLGGVLVSFSSWKNSC